MNLDMCFSAHKKTAILGNQLGSVIRWLLMFYVEKNG